MIGQLHHRGWHYLLFAGIASLLFFANLGGATLWDIDEGKNIVCSGEMMESGNWVIPTFNGELRTDKPALLYWLQIFCYRLFGFNEFSGRLPSAIAALAAVLLCYELARAMFTRTTGLIAGVIVGTSPMLCGAARFANPDSLLNACTVLTLTLFWIGLPTRRWWWYVALGAGTGLGMLAKGLVGLILPGGVAVLFLLWERRLDLVWTPRWLLASTAFNCVALPWYAWVGAETKAEFLKGFFLDHHISRGLAPMESHAGFPGFYLVVLLVGTAPWSIFLLAAWWFGVWSAVRQPWSRFTACWSSAAEDVTSAVGPDSPTQTAFRDAPAAYRLLVCWVTVYLVFFSIAATKLPNYVLPVMIPCAILMARFLQRWRIGLLQLPNWLVAAGVLGLAFFGITITVGAAVAGGAIDLTMLNGRVIPGLASWAWAGLIPLSAAGLGWWFIRRGQITRYVTTVAVTAIALVGPLMAYGNMYLNRFKAAQPLVAQSQTQRANEDIRIGCWQLEYLPSLNFYLQRNVIHFQEERDLLPFLQRPTPSYLFLSAQNWQRFEPALAGTCRVVARHYDMYRHVELVVVANQPR